MRRIPAVGSSTVIWECCDGTYDRSEEILDAIDLPLFEDAKLNKKKEEKGG